MPIPEHFNRLGRALAQAHVCEPRPKDFRELIERMVAIDPNSGMGTQDPLGGDWDSHLAYFRNRQMLMNRKGRHVPSN